MCTELKCICFNHAERSDCPVGMRELNKLVNDKVDREGSNDEICKTCEKQRFEIQQLECPVCGAQEIDRGPRSEISAGEKTYSYTCRVCKYRLFSWSKL
jgi:hypothetical protein